jgi:hypothetical protein
MKLKKPENTINLADYRVAPEALAPTSKPEPAGRATTTKMREPFARVPLAWAAKAAAATGCPGVMVWLWLLYEFWRHDGKPVPVANKKLKEWGISRKVKYRILHDLEIAELATVIRRPRQAPLVVPNMLPGGPWHVP